MTWNDSSIKNGVLLSEYSIIVITAISEIVETVKKFLICASTTCTNGR